MKTKLAVFDIDGTIFRSSLIVELVSGLVDKKIFPREVEKEIEKDYLAWVNRKASYVNYIAKVINVYQKNIKGKNEKNVKEAIKEIIKSEKNKVYVFTRELIKKLKEKNYFILAISGSPVYIVEEFSKSLGFDEFYGSVHEIKDGIFTGRELLDASQNKSRILLDFIKENKNFKLSSTIGVGDSEMDISFLELVAKQIAFNPDFKLASYAKKRNWKIIVERKNVVYDIKGFEFEITN